MNNSITKEASNSSALELTKIALITSLYMVITLFLAVISFSAVQIRLSEMFNYLALYHKRYVLAVTLGVILANLFSPTWFLDVPIGGTATFLLLLLCRSVTKNLENLVLKMVITAILFSLSMFTVAFQLVILFDLPFFYTWLTVGLGELLSMSVGGIVIYYLSKKIDFSK